MRCPRCGLTSFYATCPFCEIRDAVLQRTTTQQLDALEESYWQHVANDLDERTSDAGEWGAP